MERTAERRVYSAPRSIASIILLVLGMTIFPAPGNAQTSITSVTPNLVPCGTYNGEALDPRPVPKSIGGHAMIEALLKQGFHTPATMLGAPKDLPVTWYDQVRVTPEDARRICEKHLTAVYIDWAGAPYNLAMNSGAKMVLDALGIRLLRIGNYAFNPNGLSGVLAAILPLRPNILLTGGVADPAQLGTILKPAVDQGIAISLWAVASPKLGIGPNDPIKSLVSYDFYGLGVQLADAVQALYPNGAEFGYIHWINDSPPVQARERGFLDELKKDPKIHMVTNGAPSPSNPASGFTSYVSPQAFTVAFLTQHPNVNLLFAPWEDPPALGEAAAIRALRLEDKIKIVTMDLGGDGIYQLTHRGPIVLDMAQDVYDAGRVMALTAALSSIGKSNYPYVLVPTFPVFPNSDMRVAWDFMHGPQMKCPEMACQ
jgi:ABC-type sugar transport system substrate-binding protein